MNGNCFLCRQPDHWIKDCPQKSGNLPPSIHCRCGGGICLSKVSNTPKNPGRRFYICPAAQSCKFFKWFDEVTEEDIRFRPDFTIPECPCGSGPCRRIKVDSGPDSGRAYLICSVKKGFGACGFFRWENSDIMDDVEFWKEAELIVSNAENGNVQDKVVCEQGRECKASVEGDMFVSDIHSAVNQVTSGIPIVAEEQVPVLLVKNVPCDQPTNRAVSNSEFKESCQLNVDEVMHDLVGDPVSTSGSIVTNHGGDQATNCDISKSSFNDGLQLNVDVAMSDLVIDMVSSGSVVTNYGDQATNSALFKASYIDSCQVKVDEPVRDLARHSVSSDGPVVTNHDDQATNCALSCHLNVDQAMSGLIRDMVPSDGFVVTNHEQPVTGTKEAEWSFPNLQDLMEQYNSEKLHLENVSGKHVQVLSAFVGSYRRLRSLHEKTFQLRKELLEAEKELACCEAETLEFGTNCREVAGEMAETQKRMQETAEKLGKEVEVLKQKEFVSMKRKRS